MPAAAAASAADAPAAKPLPPGFDAEGFAQQAKIQFSRLQAAYDAGEHDAMAQVMTPELHSAVVRELEARGAHKPTEVVALNAGVLEVTTEGRSHWASVRYTGLVREDGDATPKPIDEVWNLTKPVDGSSGWLLAGIQQTAYDQGDRKALAEVMTPDMYAEVSNELAQRVSHAPTEIDKLDAQIVDVSTEGSRHWMSVRFTGLLREDGTVMAKDFDEVWNLTKPVDGSSGWLLAGIQQADEVA